MFEPQDGARVYSAPLGSDFAKYFVDGLLHLSRTSPPETLARTEIYVNSSRMERRIQEELTKHGPLLLPRIRLITSLAQRPDVASHLPQPVSPLRRRLLLARLVDALMTQEPDLAPRSALFDLSGSLAALLDEMQGEGIPFEALETIRVGELSGHWERSLRFLEILSQHWDTTSALDPQDRQRRAAEILTEKWASEPPDHPILIAGSTASRGASALFMQAVARLPLGAIVLPGVDTGMSKENWLAVGDERVSMDHPQSGISKFCRSVGCLPETLPCWHSDLDLNPHCNTLVSLSLRPAPFTDEWLEEGPKLVTVLGKATESLSLLESDNAKEEAKAVAVRLRLAAEEKQSAVLISPDRELTRRVAANLRRWGIEADDSAGRPLHQTPPGIFLRLVANCFGERLTPLMLITILKHPLCSSTENGGKLNLLVRSLEQKDLRGGAPFVDFGPIKSRVFRMDDPQATQWVNWLEQVFRDLHGHQRKSLQGWIDAHVDISEALAAGPGEEESGVLWDKEAGGLSKGVFCRLSQEADVLESLSASEYRALFLNVLHEEEVREATTPHPSISILGPREAREHSADLVILAGLNESVWPKQETPDPWLSRAMRQQIGLPLQDRQIGLSAHDFQQAIAGNEVVLSRALRDGDSPTVASRWLTRLLNLLNGLGPVGKSVIRDMRLRGRHWQQLGGLLDVPPMTIPSALRPSPQPPVDARPDQLSVTRIKTLIRDPYAVYARNVLNLKPLDVLGREPDALTRGIALHEVIEAFVTQTLDGLPDSAQDLFLEIAEDVLQKEAPWPATRRFWLARLARISGWFIKSEEDRRTQGVVAAQEVSGWREIPEHSFRLTGKADRIDVGSDGNYLIYDYKTGRIPSRIETELFDKQLQLEAAIAEVGGFDKLDARKVCNLSYVGLNASAYQTEGQTQDIDVEDKMTDAIWEELTRLIGAYRRQDQGYTARAKMQKTTDVSDFDHLSRRGEWQDSDRPNPEQVP